MSCADWRCRWSDQPGPRSSWSSSAASAAGASAGGEPLGDLLGDGVHRRADGPRRVRRRLGPDRAEHPAQRAALEGLDAPRAARARPRRPGTSGASSDSGASPHQCDGAAPGTPSSASRRSTDAAADRRCGGVCGSVSARRSSATSAGRVSERGSSVSGRPSSGGGATRSRKREAVAPASAPSSAPSTAVTTQPPAGAGAGDVEQPPLLGQGERAAVDRRRRRCRRPARRAPRCRAATVRSRRSGHTPSWTPATQTRSHSRPLDACAVSSRTVSPAAARAAPVSPGSSWAERWATNARTSADGSRSTKPGGGVEQRDDGVEVAVGDGAGRPAGRAGPRPPGGQAAALPHRPEHVLGGAVRGPAPAGRRRARRRPGGPAGRRARAATRAASRRSSTVASGAPRSAGSMPCVGQRDADRAAQPAQVEDGRAAQRRGEQRLRGRLVQPRPARRPPPARAGRRQQRGEGAEQRRDGRLRRPAAGRRRTPPPARRPRPAPGAADRARRRCGRRPPSATTARRRAGGRGAARRRGRPPRPPRSRRRAPRPRRGRCRRPAASRRCSQGPGSPSATVRLIRSSSAPDRRQTPSETRPARPAVGVPEPVGELDDAARLGAAEGVDGLVGVADGDQVAAAAGEQLEQLDLGGVGVLVLVDEQPAGPLALLAQQLGVAVELGDRLRAPARPGRSPDASPRPAVEKAVTRLVLLLEGGGVHPVLAARTRGPRRPAAPAPTPRSVARSSSSRSSVRKPAVAERRRQVRPASGRRPPPRRRRAAARRPRRPARPRSAAAAARRRAAGRRGAARRRRRSGRCGPAARGWSWRRGR